MNSKKTFFNKTIYIKNILRMWPLWGLLSIAALIASIASISILNDRNVINGLRFSTLEAKENLYDLAVSVTPIVSLVYAVIVGAVIWGYLYTQRSVVFAHSLPVSRGNLFITSFLSGLTVAYIPFLIFGISYYIGCVISGYMFFDAFATYLWITFAYSLIFFCFETLVAMLTGTRASNVILYFILNFLSISIEAVLASFNSKFLYGVSNDYKGVTEFLSPIVFLMKNVTEHKEYETQRVGYAYSDIKEITVSNQWYLVIYAAVALLLLACSYIAYRHRKSEKATEVVAFNALREILLYILVLISATGCTMAIYSLFCINNNNVLYTFIHVLPAAIVALTVCYFVIRMILDKTIKVFKKKNLIACACTLLAFLTICALFSADVFGQEKKLPAADDISAIYLFNSNTNYYFYENDEEAIKDVLSLHEAVINEGHRKKATSNDATENYLTIRYDLKNGERIDRTYIIPLYENNASISGTLESDYIDFLNQKVILENKYLFNTPTTVNDYFTVEVVDKYASVSENYFELDYGEFKNVLLADFEAGNLKGDDIFTKPEDYKLGTDLFISITKMHDDTDDEYPAMASYEFVSFLVDDDMTNICEFLKSKGIMQ